MNLISIYPKSDAIVWLKYCWYSMKFYPINQSIQKVMNLSILEDETWMLTYLIDSVTYCIVCTLLTCKYYKYVCKYKWEGGKGTVKPVLTNTCVICFPVLTEIDFHSPLTIFYVFLHCVIQHPVCFDTRFLSPVTCLIRHKISLPSDLSLSTQDFSPQWPVYFDTRFLSPVHVRLDMFHCNSYFSSLHQSGGLFRPEYCGLGSKFLRVSTEELLLWYRNHGWEEPVPVWEVQ